MGQVQNKPALFARNKEQDGAQQHYVCSASLPVFISDIIGENLRQSELNNFQSKSLKMLCLLKREGGREREREREDFGFLGFLMISMTML
jgi:hypothetical protein